MLVQNDKSRLPIMAIVAIFFGVFALSLFAAIFFTDSERGRIVNIICGLLFTVMSAGAYLISKKSK